eukprot:6587001-Prymnesium_polylepis.1
MRASEAPAAASAHARCTRNECTLYFLESPSAQPRATPTRSIHASRCFDTFARRNGSPAAVENSG